MANKDAIEVEGKVIDVLPGGKFKVELENGFTVEEKIHDFGIFGSARYATVSINIDNINYDNR